ncbi:MAG: thiamine pyrophosphate-binding protein [bacterium]|nr:thiamine pyrophosphate-binding protein [bacterium]
MAVIDGGAMFGRALRNEGVDRAFVLCGGHIMPIFYGMREAGIEIIDMRHECAALYAASAYSQVTGKPGVVVTTAGPGVGNTAAGMMEADSLGVPILHIGGSVAVNQADAGDLQDMSTLKLMDSCCKWARKITSVGRIPEYVAMGFRQAMDATPGPVYLEVPTDLLFQKMEEETVRFPVNYRASAIPCGDQSLVDEAAQLLANAERPAVIVDDGARFNIGDHAEAIAELSDYLKMPVGVNRMCRGLFGDESKNPQLTLNSAMARADVLLTLGCRFDFRLAQGRIIPKDAKVIQVHHDARQIGFNLRADIGIVGGSGPVASQILGAVKKTRARQEKSEWMDAATQIAAISSKAYTDGFAAEGSPVHPGRCAAEVAKFLEEDGRDWTLITDGGEASVWMGGASTAYRSGQILGTGPNGTIGTGPALAIGAWAANRKPVLWYTGDGSFGFYAMELDTMAKLDIPVVCVISNDSAWGMIRLAEKYIRPEDVGENGHCNVDLHPMRAYEKMTEMWGGYGESVKDPAEIVPAIKRAVAHGKPSIINVEVDQVSLSPFIAGYAKSLQASE